MREELRKLFRENVLGLIVGILIGASLPVERVSVHIPAWLSFVLIIAPFALLFCWWHYIWAKIRK